MSDPNMNPVNTASVMLRKYFRASDNRREKLVITRRAPAAKMASVVILSVFTAYMM